METTQFVPSRLSNLRDRKQSHQQELENDSAALKLTLQDDDDKSYEPTFSNTRTSMRLFKGKLEGKISSDKNGLGSANTIESLGSESKHSLFDNKEEMKLVLNDSPEISQKKIIQEVPNRQAPKRIMITRQVEKQVTQISVHKEPEYIEEPKKHEVKEEIVKEVYVNPHDEKPIIREEEAEESKDVEINENDLVMCPEGCGRKFNRKALEKHAKACKIVFMSKRKEFNSEAKRFTSKEQATIVKQTKKNAANVKGKGFEKTSDNWKTASEDFRSALKAIKREDENENEENVNKCEQNKENEGAFNLIACEFCEKMFAKVLIEKHMDNCLKKKELHKKKKTVPKKK